MRTDALDYHLPPELIATEPAEPRDSARLMVVHRDAPGAGAGAGRIEHCHVRDLPDLGILQPGDLMIANHTQVLRARLEGTRHNTGGHIKGLLLTHAGRDWSLLIESRGKLQPGERIDLTNRSYLTLHHRVERGQWAATLHGPVDTDDLLAVIGHTPLPPYILAERKRRGQPEEAPGDWARYNTTFATMPGSVAAPTAGLHFTPELLARIEALGVERAAVILNVGLGTFEPVRTDTLEDHAIHRESIMIPGQAIQAIHRAHRDHKRILAVGTTTVRAIESLPHPLPTDLPMHVDNTDLFITPDRVADGSFTWRHTDLLLTNFHLPRSTLLALVAALPGVGLDRLMSWYRIAIDEGYRFYSYGDAMLIT